LSSAIAPWSSSLLGELMRTVSPWIAACTFFILASLMTRATSRARSAVRPSWIAISWRVLPPSADSTLPGLRFLSGTWRRVSLDWSTSHIALSLNSSGAASTSFFSFWSSSIDTLSPLKS
jgi:hypothetical protein